MIGHILALDLETTGLSEHKPSIIEIGCVHYNGEERLSHFNETFQPNWNKNIALGALRVNKATPISLIVGSEHKNGLTSFVQYLCDKVFPVIGNKKLTIVGQNVAFDVQLLRNELEEIGYVGWTEVFDYGVIDTSCLGKALREVGIIEVDKLSLETLAQALGISVTKDKLHTALYDAELSAICYFQILRQLRDLKRGKSK